MTLPHDAIIILYILSFLCVWTHFCSCPNSISPDFALTSLLLDIISSFLFPQATTPHTHHTQRLTCDYIYLYHNHFRIMELFLLLQSNLNLIALMVGSYLAAQLVSLMPSSIYFPKWVAFWLALSSFLCLWDASFVLLRPASFDMLLWVPYLEYIKVDKLYGNVEDTFLWSQSIMNLIEIGLNLYTLSLLHQKQSRAASIMAVVVSAMTSSRTILYYVLEYSCGFCNSAHNNAFTLVTRYFLPGGMWIWVPAFVAFHLGGLLAEETPRSTRRSGRKKSKE